MLRETYGKLKDQGPRLTHWQWQERLADKQSMAHYIMPQHEIPIWVVSVASARGRREYITAHLGKFGIGYEIIDAVDGAGSLNDNEVSCRFYASRSCMIACVMKRCKRQAPVRKASPLTWTCPFKQVEAFVGGERLPAYDSRLDHQSVDGLPESFERLKRKIACDLSHAKLLHRMIAEDQELVIVLEDDVEVSYGNSALVCFDC